jgi:apoptosis-inducing factor 2
MAKKKIVIIGGGFSGAYSAKKLEKKFSVTLIDNKTFFEFTPSILRTLVKPSHAKKIQIKHKNYLKKTKVIFDKVIKVNSKFVLTKLNKKLYFDYLIIGSGSSYTLPIKEQNAVLTNRAEHLIKYSGKVRKAKKILIIGGGLVGVELAAELIDSFPHKEIILAQSGNQLIPRCNKKTRLIVKKFLEKKRVKLLFDTKINKSNITRMKPNLSFFCTGIKPNSNFIDKKMLDNRSFVKVNSHLQLINSKNVFAIGDVNNILLEKTAQNAIKQARIAVKNILSIEKGKKLFPYLPKETPLVISLGRFNAIFTFRNITFSGFVPSIIKKVIEIKSMPR